MRETLVLVALWLLSLVLAFKWGQSTEIIRSIKFEREPRRRAGRGGSTAASQFDPDDASGSAADLPGSSRSLLFDQEAPELPAPFAFTLAEPPPDLPPLRLVEP